MKRMVGKSSRLKQPPQQCRLLYLEKAPGSTYCGISVYNGGTISKMGMILLTKPCSDKASGGGFKWEEGRFKLDRRRAFVTMRALRHWSWLPMEAVVTPRLDLFKDWLDWALSNLTRERWPCPWQWGCSRRSLKVLATPNPSTLLRSRMYDMLMVLPTGPALQDAATGGASLRTAAIQPRMLEKTTHCFLFCHFNFSR